MRSRVTVCIKSQTEEGIDLGKILESSSRQHLSRTSSISSASQSCVISAASQSWVSYIGKLINTYHKSVSVSLTMADEGVADGALHQAAYDGNEPLVRLLLEAGRDVNEVYVATVASVRDPHLENRRGTPLYWALRTNCDTLDVVKLLIEHCNLDWVDENGQTALHIASSDEMTNSSYYYETNLFDIDIASSNALANACYLLDTNLFDINALDRQGKTPLHLACEHEGNPSIAVHLIHHGADLIARDSSGNTPLHVAVDTYSDDSEDFLESFLLTQFLGPDPNSAWVSNREESAIQIAQLRRKMLTIRNNNGHNALEMVLADDSDDSYEEGLKDELSARLVAAYIPVRLAINGARNHHLSEFEIAHADGLLNELICFEREHADRLAIDRESFPPELNLEILGFLSTEDAICF